MPPIHRSVRPAPATACHHAPLGSGLYQHQPSVSHTLPAAMLLAGGGSGDGDIVDMPPMPPVPGWPPPPVRPPASAAFPANQGDPHPD